MEFKDRLKFVREGMNLTQTQLATKTGLKPSAISHFECGRRKPDFDNLRLLCKVTNCSANYLLGLKEL